MHLSVSSKKIQLLTFFLLLSSALIAFAQTRADSVTQTSQTANNINEFLIFLGKLTNRDLSTIDIKPLSVLTHSDFEAIVKNNTTQDGLVSVLRVIPSVLNSGLVSVSYSKQYAPKTAVQYVESNKRIPPDFDTKYLKRIGIVLNPLLLCVKAQDVQKAWETQFMDETFAKLGYSAGSLWPSDGIHKNIEEQKRRGNGPIEAVIIIKTPLDSAHKSVFRFTHDYWACARSLVLERRYK